MKIRQLIAVLIGVFATAFSNGAPVHITVHSSFETGTSLITSAYRDLISYQQEYLSLDTCNQNGIFSLELALNKPRRVVLEALNFKGQFLVLPGEHYHLTIPGTYEQIMKGEVFEWDPDSASTSVSDELVMIDQAVGAFVLDKADALIGKRAAILIDLLRNELINDLEDSTSYSGIYLRYSVAQLELMNTRNNKTIYNKYIVNQPIHYDNEGYMVFLNQYYNDFFKSVPPKIKDDIINEIGDHYRIAILDTLMRMDYRLGNDTMREFITIKSLAEAWNHPDFSKKGLRLMLHEYSQQAKVSEHRVIAKTLLTKLTALRKGAKAPIIEGLTFNQDTIRSNGFGDRFVLIELTQQDCNACQKEQQVIQKLHKTYKKDIAFTSVCVDCDREQVNKTFQSNNLNWPVIFPFDSRALENELGLITYPQYLLLDQHGYILQYPAPHPSERLEYSLYKLASQRTRKKSYLIIVDEE